MKKAITTVTMAMLLLCAMAFVGCAQEADADAGNPFVGTWKTADGFFTAVFTDTTVKWGASVMGTTSWGDEYEYTYSGNIATVSVDGQSIPAEISGDTLSFFGYTNLTKQ